MMDEAGASAGQMTQPDEAKLQWLANKASDRFSWWQQLPAWILGAAAITGGGFLIIGAPLNDAQSRDAWAGVIVALFLAVLLSFRSAFTLNAADQPRGGAPQTPQTPTGPSDREQS